MNLEPAASVIRELGGISVLAGHLGLNQSTVRRFQYPRSKTGTGGSIPNVHIFPLLALSWQIGKPLSLEALVLTPTQRTELEALRKQSSPKSCISSSRKSEGFER